MDLCHVQQQMKTLCDQEKNVEELYRKGGEDNRVKCVIWLIYQIHWGQKEYMFC